MSEEISEENMRKYFDGKIPNPNQYPLSYKHYVLIYLNSRNSEQSTELVKSDG